MKWVVESGHLACCELSYVLASRRCFFLESAGVDVERRGCSLFSTCCRTSIIDFTVVTLILI